MTAPAAPPPYIRYPRAAAAAPLAARQVAAAYGAPIDHADGTGVHLGVISLGGALSLDDVHAAGLPTERIRLVTVGGARPVSDPQGADGENQLDVQVILGIAPGAAVSFYAAENTDQGFTAALTQAARECDAVSISWGGPESQWSRRAISAFSKECAAARARGVPIFVASGDAGSRDGTDRDTVDYPAADPSVIGCGGTELRLDRGGARASETTWNDDAATSATGGGVSAVFPGRRVPDIAGNADPDTGYEIVVGGQRVVVGGTSGSAPAHTGCWALLRQATGKPVDLLNLLLTNPAACFDVTVGNNGTYRAGPGRDNTTGLGVPDYGRLLGILTSGVQVPAPGGAPTGQPSGTAGGPEDLAFLRYLRQFVQSIDTWLKSKGV